MKKILLFMAYVISFTLEAGYYGGIQIDTYDPVSGNYYKSIIIEKDDKGFLSSKGKRENITNVAIYSPKTNTHKMLFEKNNKRDINIFIFETGYQHKTIQFNGETSQYGSHNPNIKNNNLILKREPRNKLLIGIRNTKKRITELWVAKKDGSELTKITIIPFDSRWHIDIKNSKLRVVTVKNGSFKIESLEW